LIHGLYCMVLDATVITIILIAGFILSIAILARWKKKKKPEQLLPDSHRKLLEQHVGFYQQLDAVKQKEFESRMQGFLSSVRITGVKTLVSDLDKVIVGASAIIPIFAFQNWEYTNLNEVLLYPDSFGEKFELQEGKERPVLGMVGDGAMQNVMILSQHALRQGFLNNTDKHNTAIHEFVHLVDKTDGEVDGIPENLLAKQYTIPWINKMHQTIKEILKGNSDINPYGATNQGEFFAVVSEYFFERPDLLKEKHPELYALLLKIFNPAKNSQRS